MWRYIPPRPSIVSPRRSIMVILSMIEFPSFVFSVGEILYKATSFTTRQWRVHNHAPLRL